MMQLKSKRFDTQKSESIKQPLQRCVSLNELIEWIGTYDVEIPEDVEQTISVFGQRWEASLVPGERERAMLFPPEPKLANLFRRGTAAALLFGEFSARQDEEPGWRNSLVTGTPLRLRSDERDRAMSMLGQTVQDARQIFWAVLNGQRPFDPAISGRYPVAMGRPEREWFDALVFETKEVFAFLYPELIVSGSGPQVPQEGACGEEAMPPGAPQRQPAHPGGLDEKRLEKQKKKYQFIERLLNEENQPRYLASSDIAKCFGKCKCLSWAPTKWSKTLGDPPAWLQPARMSPQTGAEATWHPLMIACMLAHGVRVRSQSGELIDLRINRLTLDSVFDTNVELADWRPMWGRESEFLRDLS
ncbi:hypothetical protein ACI2U3_09245 [Ralstonia nicotianae]